MARLDDRHCMTHAWHCQTAVVGCQPTNSTWSSNRDRCRRMVDAGAQAQPVVALLGAISAGLDRSCALQSDTQVCELCDTSLGGRSSLSVPRVQRLVTRIRIVSAGRTVCMRAPGARCLANPHRPSAIGSFHGTSLGHTSPSMEVASSVGQSMDVSGKDRRATGGIRPRTRDSPLTSSRPQCAEPTVGATRGCGAGRFRLGARRSHRRWCRAAAGGGQSVETASSGGPFRNR